MQRFLAFCLLALSAIAPLASETFRNPRRIATDGDPIGIKVADLNNDGFPDLIYGLLGTTPTLYVQLGQPQGSYAAPMPVTAPPSIMPNCAVVDVNSDHRPDLICPPNFLSGYQTSLLTFLGNGDGTFQTPIITAYQASAPGITALVITSGDFNNDGKPDIILNAPNTTTLSVFLGDGDGHFSLSYTLPTGYAMLDPLNIADVNGDGKPDIIRSFGPDILLGKGDGTFNSLTGPSLQPTLRNCIVKKDFDGDNRLDAVCGISSSGQAFTILHGNPDGSFNTTSPIATTTVSNPHDNILPADVEDINHDGLVDVLTYSSEGLFVFLAKPGLQFSAPVVYHIGYMEAFDKARTTFADANGDGSTDVLTGGDNGIYITYGHTDGTFETGLVSLSGKGVSRLTSADFNNDGIADIVTSDFLGLNITLGKPNGSFDPSVPLPSAPIYLNFTAPFPLLHGDFDGDGNQDLVVPGTSNYYSPQGYFLHGNGDATFATPVVIPYVSGGEPATIGTNSSVADLNHDGRDDLISADGAFIHTRMSLPSGGFSTTFASPIPDEITVGTFPPFTVGDFDHDGIPDVVPGLKNIYFLHGKGDGTFTAPGPAITIPQTPGYVTAISSADFDQDGNLDLAVLVQFPAPLQSPLFIYYGNGDGTFAAPITLPSLHSGLTAVNIGDFNRDGRPDLLLTCGSIDGCSTPTLGIFPVNVIHSLASRTFSPPDNYVGGIWPSDAAVADVSGDGYPDIILANGANIGNAFIPLINLPGSTVTGTLVATPEPSLAQQPFTLTATFVPPNASTALGGTVSFSMDGNTAGSAPVVSNAASINITTQLTRGTHRIFATWSGDNNYPGISLVGTHTVNGYPVTVTVTSSANPVVFGQSFTLQYSLSNAASVPAGIPQPSGTFSLINNGSDLFPPTTVTSGLSGSAFFALGLAPAGQHTLVASYSGDSIHEPASATIVENVTAISSTTVLQTSPNPSVYGQPITVSATITVPTGNSLGRLLPPPQPTVTFTGFPGGPVTTLALFSLNQSTSNTTVLTASYTATSVPAGTYNITAAYSGNINSQPSASSPIAHIVLAAPTTTTLTATPASAYQHQAIVLSARVAGALAAPTGSVQFLDGSTPLSTVALASGAASLSTSQLNPGNHSITAVYRGDANNLTSTSSAVTVTILPSDFTVSLDPPSISLVTGHHTTIHLSASSLGNFDDTIRLGASSLPQWVTVQFKPVDLKLTAGSTATISVYIDTDAVIGYMSQVNPRPSRRRGIPAAAAAFALILAPITLRRRRRITALFTLALSAALLAGTTGCSGKYPDSTVPGVYTLKIIATGAQTGLTHTINLPLTVTQ